MHTGNTRIILRILLLLLALLLACSALLCFLTSQNIRPAYNLLSSISPSAALKLRPEQHSAESSGITMQLASVQIEDTRAVVAFTLQDTAGSRIDGSSDLEPFYRVQQAFPATGYCELLTFDEAGSTASYAWHIARLDDRSIRGEKIVFSLSEIPYSDGSTTGRWELTLALE